MRAVMITSWKDHIDRDIIRSDYIKYIIWQKEECPETKKEHLQIYCELSEGLTMKQIKILFDDDKIHIEPRKGSQWDAIQYCSKKETRIDGPFTCGKRAQQGHRSDLDSIMDYIEDNATAREILLQFRGNAIRHIAAVSRSLSIFHEFGNDGDLDRLIRRRRGTLRYDSATEVEGNTVNDSSTSAYGDFFETDSNHTDSEICPRCHKCDCCCKCPSEPLKKEKKR